MSVKENENREGRWCKRGTAPRPFFATPCLLNSSGIFWPPVNLSQINKIPNGPNSVGQPCLFLSLPTFLPLSSLTSLFRPFFAPPHSYCVVFISFVILVVYTPKRCRCQWEWLRRGGVVGGFSGVFGVQVYAIVIWFFLELWSSASSLTRLSHLTRDRS